MPENNPTPTTQTFDELTVNIVDWSSKLDKAAGSFSQAQTSYDNITNRMRYGSDEGHQIALRDHLPALEAAENAALSLANGFNAYIRPVLEVTKSESTTLTDAETAVAASKQIFIKEDCTELPYEALVSRVQQAITHGDRPAMYLYHRYGTMRLRIADGPESNEKAKAAFWRLLSAIEQKLTTGKAKEVNALALKTLSQAHSLASTASKRRAADQVYSFQKPGEVPWPD